MNKVFGIGLSRTGTASLTYALRILGYRIIHYPKPCIVPGLIDKMKDVDGGTDTPIAVAYKDLDEAFPDSKFILTTRSLESWLTSVRNYKHLKHALEGDVEKIRLLLYECNIFDEEKFKEAYFRHHREVKEYFVNRNDLLIMNIIKGDGWEKLCGFLDREIPEVLFPDRNKSSTGGLREEKRLIKYNKRQSKARIKKRHKKRLKRKFKRNKI